MMKKKDVSKNSELLTHKEAANFLRVSESFLDKNAKKLGIRKIKLGKCVRYMLADLEICIKQRIVA